MKLEKKCSSKAIVNKHGVKTEYCLKYHRTTDKQKCRECGEEMQDIKQ